MKSLLIVPLLLLWSCAAPLQAPTTTELPPPPLPQQPRPMTMLDVEWKVIVDESGEVWLALTIPGYESLSLNFAEIERYIQQQEINNEYLRDRLVPSDENL